MIPYLREKGFVKEVFELQIQGQRYFETYLENLERNTENVGVRTFNVSLYRAKKLLENR